MFRSALHDSAASITALEQALSVKPDYAPAILSMGSVEYQRQRKAEGKRLFFSLLSLPQKTEDLCEIIDEAGSFLISVKEYADGLELDREAARKFPDVAALRQGIGCCAGHEGVFAEALAASRRAIELDPENAEYVSDLGWTLLLAEQYHEAETEFLRALAMDPSNERTQANLDHCRERMAEGSSTVSNTPMRRALARRAAAPSTCKKRSPRRDDRQSR
jgi:tetratricopeptide (TPR) repeat protein